jgi:hypothetical protein
MLRHFRRR